MKTYAAKLLLACAPLVLAACDSGNTSSSNASQTPNILFVIMDDVGIDQMASFGYGGLTPPRMPNINAVAQAGLRFRNAWAMPECSLGRASFFVGQFPPRTNIYQAIGPNDLANSHVSPFATTAPKLLKKANYESGLFGKFHLGGPENNEAGNAAPHTLGWDYFYGWLGGLPGSIDTTAGGLATAGTHKCGFVPRQHAGGSNSGACYKPDNSCTDISVSGPALHEDAPGLQCIDSGGVFAPNQTCNDPRPSGVNFNQENAYYVSPLVINDGDYVEEVPLTDMRARGYRTRIETDAAIDWINSRPSNRPWMATVSYTAAHTPWQQPPVGLLSENTISARDSLDCGATGAGRLLQNQMTEAMDAEFGRLMVEIGLAQWDSNGRLVYNPAASNTTVVIVGDNGTLGTAVKQPFSPSEAKGTAYQTGIWTPLIVAGPQVQAPNRDVENMVNMVDVFQFFGEIANLNVHDEAVQTLDSTSLMAYVQNPGQETLRTINFAMGSFNYQANNTRNAPCVISTSCTQIPVSKSVCEDNQGVWWGPGYTDASVIPNGTGYSMCWEVNKALANTSGRDTVTINPETSIGIRNEQYKLVRNISQEYDASTPNSPRTVTEEELYQINQDKNRPLLDTPDRDLLQAPTSQTLAIYDDLKQKMDQVLASNPLCPGDGNLDRVVNGDDVEHWSRIAREWGKSSMYDFMVSGAFDGLTNATDGNIIQTNLNQNCDPVYAIY